MLRKLISIPYIILITGTLTKTERCSYLKAGVNTTITKDTDRNTVYRTLRFLFDHYTNLSVNAVSEIGLFKIPQSKRFFDVVVAIMGILVCAPVMLCAAIAIRIESRGPIICRIKRVGSNFRIFDLFRFRSYYITDVFMNSESYPVQNDKKSHKSHQSCIDSTTCRQTVSGLADRQQTDRQRSWGMDTDNRCAESGLEYQETKIGRILCKYHVDRLPQLFNILRGEMSIVGNRPLSIAEAEQLTSDESIDRFMTAAGLTGLWQLEKTEKNESVLPDEGKQLDVHYAHNCSMIFDLRIILCSLKQRFLNNSK